MWRGAPGRRGANGTETEGSQTGVDAAAILYDCLSDSVQLYSVSIGASTGIRLSGWLRTNKRTFIYSRISAAEPSPESIPDTALRWEIRNTEEHLSRTPPRIL